MQNACFSQAPSTSEIAVPGSSCTDTRILSSRAIQTVSSVAAIVHHAPRRIQGSFVSRYLQKSPSCRPTVSCRRFASYTHASRVRFPRPLTKLMSPKSEQMPSYSCARSCALTSSVRSRSEYSFIYRLPVFLQRTRRKTVPVIPKMVPVAAP
jgi:hypothetical protein